MVSVADEDPVVETHYRVVLRCDLGGQWLSSSVQRTVSWGTQELQNGLKGAATKHGSPRLAIQASGKQVHDTHITFLWREMYVGLALELYMFGTRGLICLRLIAPRKPQTVVPEP